MYKLNILPVPIIVLDYTLYYNSRYYNHISKFTNLPI